MQCEFGILKQLVSFGLTTHHNQKCVTRLIDNSFAYIDGNGTVHGGKYEHKGHSDEDPSVVEYSQFVEYSEGCGSILDQDFLNSDFRNELQDQFKSNCFDKKDCVIDLPYNNIRPQCL